MNHITRFMHFCLTVMISIFCRLGLDREIDLHTATVLNIPVQMLVELRILTVKGSIGVDDELYDGNIGGVYEFYFVHDSTLADYLLNCL